MVAANESPEMAVTAITRAFRRPLGFAVRLAVSLLVLLLFIVTVLFARAGTDLARGASALALVLCLLGLLVISLVRKRKWRDPRSALYHALRRVDDETAARAERAFGTYRRLSSGGEGGGGESDRLGESPDLARLHVSRMLARLPLQKVEESGQMVRRRWMRGGLFLGAACLALLLSRPLVVIEGVDVLFARGGVGPFPIAYVEQMSVTSELPSYLDGTGKKRPVFSRLASIPQGSEIEVRVVPTVSDRKLLLTDGIAEVPLVSDGQGGLVARWSADDAAVLRVAARFGQVLLYDANETLLSPLEDRPPQVLLSGAPSSRQLADLDELSLDYTAVDDHGLTQVDLVITSGQRSHREELAHLDGQRQSYRGAHRLTKEHDMFRRAFLPVHVTVEARDGNTATGPNWGKSRAITLIPEPLGKEIAERHKSLREFRQALTTYLAKDIEASHLTISAAKDARKEAHEALLSSYETLETKLLESTNVPKHSLAFLEAQLEALSRKGVERSTSESVLLAADALLQTVGDREAADLARDLGAAVEEIAVQARQLRFETEGVHLQGLDDLMTGAKEGAVQLREVGILGLDLGSVAIGDLTRIARTLVTKEYGQAEAAAMHLAERLKRATPSFGSKGGAVEAGTPTHGGGQGQAEGPPSEAPGDFDEMSQQLDDLAQDAATELTELEKMLREAQRAAEADFQSSPELGDVARELREKMGQLPHQGSASFGPRGDAAAARGYGEAMAEALEAGDLSEAVERGLDADEALRRAEKSLEQASGWLDEGAVEEARQALDRALEEARRASEDLQKNSERSVSEPLGERAQMQREFSERAKDLAKRGADPSAPLPERSIEALRRASELLERAAQAMEAGRGEEGAEHATDAQVELERAVPDQSESQGSDGGDGAEGNERSTARDGSVPDEERDRARDFRERVEKGLGRGSGRLSPAVRRYAEELK